MVYFFSRARQFVQCEIHPGPPHVLTLIEPGGSERTELHDSTGALHERWEEVQQQLALDGWQGPFGRDSRI
jgi:hypothetical protein